MTDHTHYRTLGTRLILLIVAALFGFGTMSSLAAPATGVVVPSRATARAFRTANGIVIQAGAPLPIFAMAAPAVNGDGSVNLAQQFDSIYDRQSALTDTYRGGVRYTVPNTTTNSILERYSASGGFYAYNAKAAFSETAQGSLTAAEAESLACNFLFKPNSPNNSFVDIAGRLLVGHDAAGPLTPQFSLLSIPPPTDCTKPGYPPAHLIWSNTQTSSSQTLGTPQAIGAVVEVPMRLDIGQLTSNLVPIGGAGGHISLLFRPSPSVVAVSRWIVRRRVWRRSLCRSTGAA